MSRVEVAGIVPGEDSEIHDEPHVEGRRITVRFIYNQVSDRELHPETVAERFDLGAGDVYSALAYYHRNPDEMRAVERRRAELSEQATESTTLTPPEG